MNRKALKRGIWLRGQPKLQKKGVILAIEAVDVAVEWLNYVIFNVNLLFFI